MFTVDSIIKKRNETKESNGEKNPYLLSKQSLVIVLIVSQGKGLLFSLKELFQIDVKVNQNDG